VLSTNDYWFPAKAPLTWQGWVALVVWVGLVGEGSVFLHRHHHPFTVRVGYALMMLVVLAVVVCKKGDPARYTYCGRSNNRSRGP
jgi:hypothetical protein